MNKIWKVLALLALMASAPVLGEPFMVDGRGAEVEIGRGCSEGRGAPCPIIMRENSEKVNWSCNHCGSTNEHWKNHCSNCNSKRRVT